MQTKTLPRDDAATPEQLSALDAKFQERYAELREELERNAPGQHVVINVKTGEHVIAPWPNEALDLARRTFGSTDWCWSRKI